MAILEMKRIEILSMLSDSKTIMDLIQQYGVIEFSNVEADTDKLYKLSTSTALSQLDKFHSIATSALDILNEYVPEKGSMLASFAPRKEMSVSEFFFKAQEADAILSKCYGINALYKEIQDNRVEIVRAQTAIDSIMPWIDLDIPSSFRGTVQTSVFIGSIPKLYDRESLLSAIAVELPEVNFDAKIISADKTQTCAVTICHKDDAKDFEQVLRGLGFVNPSDPTKHAPEYRLNRMQKKIEKCNEEILNCEEKIKAYNEEREQIEFLIDYFTLRTDKYKSLDKISMSENIFILSGYIPQVEVDALVNKLEEHFDVAISVTDPDYENEEVPVAVQNGALASTMESVTNMYSPPSSSDVDPNVIMPYFYYCFFGLMLGDAGYGLLMVILTLFIKLKYKPEGDKAKAVNYGLCCGIGTTFWGVMLNSWFGDLPTYLGITIIAEKHLYWFEPIKYTTDFLLFAFFLGILHLALAHCVDLYSKAKKGHLMDGIFDNIPIIMILFGVLPIINSQIGGEALNKESTKFIYDFLTGPAASVFNILLIAGAVLIVLTHGRGAKGIIGKFFGGLNALYGAASGYLGDILSYSRLLALGLCTGVIASVINMLASMPGNSIVFIVICVLGHTLNLAINVIGAYVHTNRLQYVEFFSKFYEGGGRLFAPLSVNSKTFKFKEEIKS